MTPNTETAPPATSTEPATPAPQQTAPTYQEPAPQVPTYQPPAEPAHVAPPAPPVNHTQYEASADLQNYGVNESVSYTVKDSGMSIEASGVGNYSTSWSHEQATSAQNQAYAAAGPAEGAVRQAVADAAPAVTSAANNIADSIQHATGGAIKFVR